jgi:hypothetical protein
MLPRNLLATAFAARQAALSCHQMVKMVQLQRDSLNFLFDVLLEWETHLAQHDPSDLRCDDEHIRQ